MREGASIAALVKQKKFPKILGIEQRSGKLPPRHAAKQSAANLMFGAGAQVVTAS